MTAFSIMTFNLRGSFIPDGINAWPARAGLAYGLIRREAPDLIGLQEAQQGNLDGLAAEFPDYGLVKGPRYNNRDPFAWPSVMWNPNRLERIDSGEFWLSTTPDRHSGDWETNCIRSALWTRFRLLPEKTEFVHLNTHLDHISAQARLEGSRVILDQLRPFARRGLPMVLTGDFNANPGSQPHRLYLDEGFADLFLETGGRDGEEVFTFHGFTGRRVPGEERIDWIFARPGAETKWEVRSHRILTEAEPPVYPSDHYPVAASVALVPREE